MKTLSAAVAAAALLAAPTLAAPEYVSIPMEIDVNAPAKDVWSKIGGYCDIGVWGKIDCTITSGDGGIGTVRSLAGGRVSEILIAKTDLSYGYTQPVVDGQFYNLYHGFMEAKPVTDKTSKILYTLMLDVSNLPDQAAKDKDVAGRRERFEAMLKTMKEMAEK